MVMKQSFKVMFDKFHVDEIYISGHYANIYINTCIIIVSLLDGII